MARSAFELFGGGFQVRRSAELGSVGRLDLELFAGRWIAAVASSAFADGKRPQVGKGKAAFFTYARLDQLNGAVNHDPGLWLGHFCGGSQFFYQITFFSCHS
jgi:hypothetical protein